MPFRTSFYLNSTLTYDDLKVSLHVKKGCFLFLVHQKANESQAVLLKTCCNAPKSHLTTLEKDFFL